MHHDRSDVVSRLGRLERMMEAVARSVGEFKGVSGTICTGEAAADLAQACFDLAQTSLGSVGVPGRSYRRRWRTRVGSWARN
eukprot:1500268-Rhodomonas_salina.1